MSGKVREYEVCLNCGSMVRPDDEGCCDCGLTEEAAERAFAFDKRDTEPLVEAARRMCRANAGMVNAMTGDEVEEATAQFDAASDHLATRLHPFEDQEGEQDG